VGQADRDELSQLASSLVEDSEGAVAGVDEVDGRLDDALEHGRQLEVTADGHHGVEELAEPLGPGLLGARARVVGIGQSPAPGCRFRSASRAAYAAASVRRSMPSLASR